MLVASALPPTFQWYWLQLCLLGAVIAIHRLKVSTLTTAVLAFGLAFAITAVNAGLCSLIIYRPISSKFFIQGFFRFILVAPLLVPLMLIAPASCVLVRGIIQSTKWKPYENLQQSQVTVFEILFLVVPIIAIAAWQLNEFVVHS